MKRITFIYLLVLFLACNSAFASLAVNIDAAQFRYKESKILWELFYSIEDKSLNYIQLDSNSFKAEINVSVKIYNEAKTFIDDNWLVPNFVKDPAMIGGLIIHGNRQYSMDPGQYIVDLKIEDKNNPKEEANKQFRIFLRDFNDQALDVSSIQLAHTIESADTSKKKWDPSFKKNGLYVLPNPSTEFAGDEPNLFLYSEVYNTDKFAPNGYVVEYSVYDGAQREVFTTPIERNFSGSGVIEKVKIPLYAIPSGVYTLSQKIIYPKEEPTDTLIQNQVFYLNNYGIPPNLEVGFTENITFERSEFATYSEERANLELQMANVIATNEEEIQIDNITGLKAKQRFLFAFWKERDPDTTTVKNERLIEFRRGVEFSNAYFQASLRSGWDSERGHVVLKYGIPEERIFKMADDEINAYEEWLYTQYQGGIRFYFVDISGIGDFVLVHSTAMNEQFDPEWYEKFVIKKGVGPDFDDNEFIRPTFR